MSINDKYEQDRFATLQGLRQGFILTANNSRLEPSSVRVSPETAKLMAESIQNGSSFTSHLIPDA